MFMYNLIWALLSSFTLIVKVFYCCLHTHLILHPKKTFYCLLLKSNFVSRESKNFLISIIYRSELIVKVSNCYLHTPSHPPSVKTLIVYINSVSTESIDSLISIINYRSELPVIILQINNNKLYKTTVTSCQIVTLWQ